MQDGFDGDRFVIGCIFEKRFQRAWLEWFMSWNGQRSTGGCFGLKYDVAASLADFTEVPTTDQMVRKVAAINVFWNPHAAACSGL